MQCRQLLDDPTLAVFVGDPENAVIKVCSVVYMLLNGNVYRWKNLLPLQIHASPYSLKKRAPWKLISLNSPSTKLRILRQFLYFIISIN